MALATHEDSKLVESGREPADGHPAQCQQQALLAHGKNPGDATSIVERVVESARSGQRQRPVEQSPGLRQLKYFIERLNLLNRPLQTRMVGGVRGQGARNSWLPDYAAVHRACKVIGFYCTM